MSFRDVGRNLLEDSFNKSNLLIDVINKNNRDALNRSALPSDTNREDLAAMGGVPFEVRPRDCNKTIILVPICLLSLIITLALFNEVTNGYLKSFNSHSSVANLMVLLHTCTHTLTQPLLTPNA